MSLVHMIEFKTREGLLALQRVDHISTILESTIPVKAGHTRTVMYLLLQNGNKVEVVGETRESLFTRIRECVGAVVILPMKTEEAVLEEVAA